MVLLLKKILIRKNNKSFLKFNSIFEEFIPFIE